MENELNGSAFSIFSFRNKFTLSIRTVKSGSVSHFPFSILNFVLLCCNIYSFLFFSALVCSTVLYCSLLFCSLLCSVYFLAKKCPFLAKK